MLDSLRARFPSPAVQFSLRDRLVMIDMANAFGTATLTTHGGTVLSYIPTGGEEVLWVSETAVYDGSKPVRGGVPVCWPWFGPHDPSRMGPDSTDAAKKAHGFARHEVWEIESVIDRPGGETEVVLGLTPNPSIAQAWPHDFRLRLRVTLGKELRIDLVGQNLSERDWVVSEALHTYFRVGEAEGLVIRGLEGVRYIDKHRGDALLTQAGALEIAPPLDRVYVDHTAPLAIEDVGNRRKISIAKEGSASTIVWNPGAEGVKAFADMPDEQYHAMVCVEAGNALNDVYTLEAGGTHTMSMTIRTRLIE